jgi:hypothetical protein
MLAVFECIEVATELVAYCRPSNESMVWLIIPTVFAAQ